ncbi:hypothetical protein [Okeania sp. SIO2B3]|uniref:cyanobactin maturation protease PatG family protein n=1 Tax=Okeania sp. SIO2B3 TaxID=2607784 RepID=UPI0013C159DC|nr:hypothetical protein [Okeania sp. SIO2B3]NET46284.1 hypothetical protein [Okeania sp. SIO2B3]
MITEQVQSPEVETAAPNAVATTQAVPAPSAVAVAPAAIQNPLPVTLSVTTPSIAPQECDCEKSDGTTAPPPTPIYSLGSIRAAFPNISLEKQFEAAAATIQAQGPTNNLLYQVLSQGENLYIAMNMCYIFQIDTVDVYILKPRTYVELAQFITALDPSLETPLDGIIGIKGPLAPPEMCNGLQLPLVAVNQSFISNLRDFVDAIASASGVSPELAQSVLEMIMGLTDNTGATDEYRAINYLAVKYPQIYTTTAQMLDPEQSPGGFQGAYYLVGVTAELANVQGTRRIVNVIFQYMQRVTGESAYWFTTVDVTGLYPFLVSKFAPYYPGP